MDSTNVPDRAVPFALLHIDHVVIRAADPQRLIDFYQRALGCTVAWSRPELGLTHLSAGRAMIDILARGGPLDRSGLAAQASQGQNVDHVCLSVENFDYDAIKTHFETFGVDVVLPENRYGADGFARSIYVRDPEGNGIELKESSPGDRIR